jgi:hypothetical protein
MTVRLGSRRLGPRATLLDHNVSPRLVHALADDLVSTIFSMRPFR